MKLVIFIILVALTIFPTTTFIGLSDKTLVASSAIKTNQSVELPISVADNQTSCGNGFCKLNKKK